MPTTTLFSQGTHRNLLLPDFGEGAAVQANQHLIIDGNEGMILDPGGHKVYSKILAESMSQLAGAKLKHIFLSHQDPDIVAAINGWLMTTDATAHASALWTRFIPHFGLDRLVVERLKPIEDKGSTLQLGGTTLEIIPAHFLHSVGNFHVYDPASKILYTGDLGASLGQPYVTVPDFDAHIQYMEGFHKRYMAGHAALEAWAERIAKLDIECIAPQHGAILQGKDMAQRFIAWVRTLSCGMDEVRAIYGLT